MGSTLAGAHASQLCQPTISGAFCANNQAQSRSSSAAAVLTVYTTFLQTTDADGDAMVSIPQRFSILRVTDADAAGRTDALSRTYDGDDGGGVWKWTVNGQ